MAGRWLRWCRWVVAACLLAGCSLEGGAVVRPTALPLPTPTAPPDAPAADPGWRLGVTEEPVDLYPYSFNARAAAPLIELLYPAPLTVVSEAYTTSGVLERVPSFANGDVAYITTTVNLDASGAITQTQTGTITSVRQLAVTYRWNPNLRWADGAPVTAADSVFAFQVLRGSAATPQLSIQSDLTADYVAVDEHTTKAFLPPGRDDPNYLSTVWTPLPRQRFEGTPTPQQVAEALGRDPLGYGPYRLTSWTTQLEFARAESAAAFAGSFPERLTVRMFPDLAMLRADIAAGLTDVGWSEALPGQQREPLAADAAAGKLQAMSSPTPIWEHLDFNLAVPALQDIRMRRAIALGFNRQALVAELYGADGRAWDSWIAPESWAYAPDRLTRYPYDPAQANALLDEMGYKDANGDGTRDRPDSQPFTLTLITSEQTAVRQAISNRLVADMAALGVQIDVRTLSTQQLYSQQGPLFQRQFELALFGWLRGADPDGAVLWSCAAIPNQINNFTGDNFTGWCIDTADAAIRAASATLDQTARGSAYADHQEIMSRELPIVPLFDRRLTVIARPAIKGVQPDPFAPLTWNLARWQR
ncbi:MAG TPA: peptide ABC transporter substrate-binding protein [Herpetosiphonaceae bacterium]